MQDLMIKQVQRALAIICRLQIRPWRNSQLGQIEELIASVVVPTGEFDLTTDRSEDTMVCAARMSKMDILVSHL